MILSPSRDILIPKRRQTSRGGQWWRLPRIDSRLLCHQCGRPIQRQQQRQQNMANLGTSGGNLVFGSGGNLAICAATYYQARLCTTGALSGLWLPASSIASFPLYVKRTSDGLYYVFLSTDEGSGGTAFGAFISASRSQCMACGGTFTTPYPCNSGSAIPPSGSSSTYSVSWTGDFSGCIYDGDPAVPSVSPPVTISLTTESNFCGGNFCCGAWIGAFGSNSCSPATNYLGLYLSARTDGSAWWLMFSFLLCTPAGFSFLGLRKPYGSGPTGTYLPDNNVTDPDCEEPGTNPEFLGCTGITSATVS